MRSDALRDRLAELDRQGLRRQRRTLDGPQGLSVVCDGQPVLNFCSNDYLGLANHPKVVEALQQGASAYGVGSGASHLVCGHGQAHHALEEDLADHLRRDRVLLFSTGYMANIGVISALAGRGDEVWEDRLNHASLLDGARLSGARLRRYGHADLDSLDQGLAAERHGLRLIASDGVFSMDGDLAPVIGLAQVAADHEALLLIDDAHGIGVLGPTGGGVLEASGLTQSDVPLLVGTLGKACGSFGAFVAGSEDMIEYLMQTARSYIFTTALPPAVAVATRAALRLLREEGWRRQRLAELIARFRTGAEQLGLSLMPSSTPIQPILIGSNQAAQKASMSLRNAGFLVGAIRPPTVPVGTARLRITLTAGHGDADVDGLLAALAEIKGLRSTNNGEPA
ncbi:MAG: 8-amino-7-oxononanoate synthase [Methylococcaceae bacterium]|jgi:8-amino-7-oxononanoate synthase